VKQKSRVRQASTVAQNGRLGPERMVAHQGQGWQKLGRWLCAVVICLGIVLPKAEVMATSVDQVSFLVAQTLNIEGIAPPELEQEFTYVLEAMESENPLPPGSVDNRYFFVIKGSQKISLETLTFTEVGEYHYQLRLAEIKTDKAFTCDQEVYELTVYVTENSGVVRAYAMAVNKAGLKNDELRFTHNYKQPDSIPTDVPPTSVPPTDVPPTSVPPTSVPPTNVSPTGVPPTNATTPDGTQSGPKSNPPSNNTQGQTTTGAKTGDDTQVFLFAGVGVIALLTMMGILVIRKKNREKS